MKKVLGIMGILGGWALEGWGAIANNGFDPNANSSVWSIAVQTDGKILVGDGFTSINGLTRNRIV